MLSFCALCTSPSHFSKHFNRRTEGVNKLAGSACPMGFGARTSVCCCISAAKCRWSSPVSARFSSSCLAWHGPEVVRARRLGRLLRLPHGLARVPMVAVYSANLEAVSSRCSGQTMGHKFNTNHGQTTGTNAIQITGSTNHGHGFSIGTAAAGHDSYCCSRDSP